MFVTAIIVAAGKGRRFRSSIPKPFITLGSARIIEHCIKTLKAVRNIRQIIIAVSPGGTKYARDAVRQIKSIDVHIIAGGARRQDSVRNCLRVVDPRAEIVLIHDGVRPLVRKETISAVIRKAAVSGAAIAAVPVKNTVKRVAYLERKTGTRVKEIYVRQTLARSELWEAQTPQAFRKDIIVKAYCAGSAAESVTDDASLVEQQGHRVAVVEGDYANIKITTPEDLVIAKALLKERSLH